MRHVRLGDTFYFKFTTRDFDTGAPQTLGGTPVISAYEDANLAQITAGITLTADYDSTTGLNHVAVVATAGNGYEDGKYYAFTITTGTVDGVSVVGEVVHEIVIGPVDADVREWLSNAVTASGGVPDVNIQSTDDIDLSATQKASVNTEVDNSIVTYGLDHLVSAAVVGADVTDNSIVAQLASSQATADWDTFDNENDSLQALKENGLDALNDVSAADVNAQCDTALSDIGLDHLVSAAVVGADITDNSIIAKLASSSATADWDDFVNTTDSLQAISDSGGGGPTAAAIADAVWDEAQADHVAAGSFGVVATEIADVLTDTADMQPKLGTPAGADMSADIAAVKAETALIVADTNELQTDWADAGRLDAILDARASQASVDGLNDLAAGDILTTALTEAYAADGAAPTLSQILYMIWSLIAERSISGTTLTAKKLDGSTAAMTFTLDNGTSPTSQTRAT